MTRSPQLVASAAERAVREWFSEGNHLNGLNDLIEDNIARKLKQPNTTIGNGRFSLDDHAVRQSIADALRQPRAARLPLRKRILARLGTSLRIILQDLIHPRSEHESLPGRPAQSDLLLGDRQIATALLATTATTLQLLSRIDPSDPHFIRSLIATTDALEGYERGHSERVSVYAVATARELMLHDRQIVALDLAARLHDIGVIRVPETILNKSGRLTEEEREVIRWHPLLGVSIIDQLPHMEVVAPIVLQHHERFDGLGYPRGLAGPDTHILAQILTVAESYEAMTRLRPYRRALTREEAIAELRKGAGGQYSPIVVEVFVKASEGVPK